MIIAALVGFLFGFIGSIPVAGPIAVLVFSRGVEARYGSAIAISLGAALAEGAYAFLAFWGFSTFLTEYAIVVPISRGAAAAILAALGVVFLRRKTPASAPAEPPRGHNGASFLLGFTITALNPTLLATWSAAATTLFSSNLIDFGPERAWPFAFGAVLGIVAWFGTLLLVLRRVRGRFRPETLDRVIRVMGALLIGLSVWFLVQLVGWIAAPPAP